ncbi:MAG TPA: hypothetical protein DEO82_04140 [Eubacterium sp.]|nr:hypothetical protein [Eubacterium sp.]
MKLLIRYKWMILLYVLLSTYSICKIMNEARHYTNLYRGTAFYAVSSAAFIYFAGLFLIVLYITARYTISGCRELCFGIYGAANLSYMWLFSVLNLVYGIVLSFAYIHMLKDNIRVDKVYAGCIIECILIHYVLPGFVAVLMGFLIGYIKNLKISAFIAFIALFFTSTFFKSLVENKLVDSRIKIILENLNLFQDHDNRFNFMILDNIQPYKWGKIIGIICLFFVPLVIFFQRRFRKMTVTILLAGFVIGEVVYLRPVSRIQEQHLVLNYDLYYHLNPVTDSLDEKSPFVIQEYDLDLKFTDIINAVCEVTLEDDAAGEYTFTLYHNLKLKSVLVDGKKADYRRYTDFVTVNRPKGAKITFVYYGNVDYCMVDDKYVYVPEEMPIYPVAGKRMISDGALNGMMNDYRSHMKVKLNRSGVYSNLTKTGKNIYEGDVFGLYLLKADVREVECDDYTLLVPEHLCDDCVGDDDKNREYAQMLVTKLKERGCLDESPSIVCLCSSYTPLKTSGHVGDGYIEINSLAIKRDVENTVDMLLKQYEAHMDYDELEE